MADKQNVTDVPPQTSSDNEVSADQEASPADSGTSQIAAEESPASAANQPGSAPTVSDGTSAANATATPTDGAAAAAAAAPDDGAAQTA